MKKANILTVIICNLFLLLACGDDQMGSATGPVAPSMQDLYQQEPTWVGRYFGFLPCADCDGMATTIELNEDYSYILKYCYLGKSKEVIEFKGYFEWEKEGEVIRIGDPTLGEKSTYYQLSLDGLTQMKNANEPFSDGLMEEYQLEKLGISLDNKRWDLVEMMGVNINGPLSEKEPFIFFNDSPNTFNGFGKCNSLFGEYNLISKHQLQINKIGSTRKACQELDKEQAFMQILQQAKFYSLSIDSLQLGKDSGVADLIFVFNPFKP
jgi:copper homeostasis protein (lipoprotein)